MKTKGSNQKKNSVCYNTVNVPVAMGESLVGHAPISDNVTNLMTKFLYEQIRKYLASNIFLYIHDDH